MSQERSIMLAPGTATAGSMIQGLNLPEGTLLVFQDLLSIGPLQPRDTLEEWRTLRENYLRSLDPDPLFRFADFRRDLFTNPETLIEAEVVSVWIGTGLGEQLLLAWMPQLFRLLGRDLPKLEVVQFVYDEEAGFETQSVGVLSPEQLKAHPPAQLLDGTSVARLEAAWAAVSAANPDLLTTFLQGPADPLPLLHRSLHSIMGRFPDVDCGLGYWDLMLLHAIADKGPEAIRVVGFTMGWSSEGKDWVGAQYLFARLHRLADPVLKKPLVLLSGNTKVMRETKVELTDFGKDVRVGNANAVAVNGIDDWVGGIHLNSDAGRIWFQRNGVLVADHDKMA
jgi:hypothetical protein